MKNKIKNYRNSGFTLIELLIVVLIIGVLTAAAVPSFRQAIARVRYNKLLPVAKSVKTAEEAYYLANTKYTGELSELDVSLADAQEENDFFFFGGDMKLSLNVDSTHENVRLTVDGLNNRYVSYFDKSPNFPGEIHCEALSSDEKAKSLCELVGGTEHGSTGSYTTYLLKGAGLGTLTDAPARLTNDSAKCQNNTASDCVRKEYDDGSYTETSESKICSYASNQNPIRCTSYSSWGSISSVEYDPETGNKIKEGKWYEYSDGEIDFNKITEYDPVTGNKIKESERSGAFVYVREYDEQGRITKETDYFAGERYYGSTVYEYDEETGKLSSKVSYDEDGEATDYYEYDPETGKKILQVEFNSKGEVEDWSTYDPETGRETEEVYTISNGKVYWHDTYDPETGESSSVYYDWTTQEVERVSGYDENGDSYSYYYNDDGSLSYASGHDENGNYYSVNYDSEGNITSYYSDGNSYYADGSIQSTSTYTSEDNENGYNYRNDYYSYNQDGSYSHSWDSESYDSNTGDYDYSSGTNYYDSEGNFTGAYDGGNTYHYENGQLSSVYDEYNYSEYTFNSDGSLSSVDNNDYGYHIEFNSDGSVNYANSYGEWGDSSTSAIDSVVSNYQSNWGTASDYPSYDSWDTSGSTVTQDSWGTADTSSWPSQDSWPSNDSWPSADSIVPPTVAQPDDYVASNEEKTHGGVELEPSFCEYYPDDAKC